MSSSRSKKAKKDGVIRHDRKGLADYWAGRAVRLQNSLDKAVADLGTPRRIK